MTTLDAVVPADAPYTLTDPNLTVSFDKISCMRGAYFAHVVFCYLMFLSGIFAFVTRLIPAIKWTHAWMGRAYIMSMLWATATSLIIHNTGLPPATLISFIWVLGGMCIAWVVIKVHEARMEAAAAALVQQQLAGGDASAAAAAAKDLRGALAAARVQVVVSRTFVQRFFTAKAMHGILMFVSWINVAGRIFASDQSGDFTCHTYPVYKPITTKHFAGAGAPITLVPGQDPNFARLPWARTGLVGWSLALLLGPLVGAALVGAGFSFFGARQAGRRTRTTPGGGAHQAEKLAAVEAGFVAGKDSSHAAA